MTTPTTSARRYTRVPGSEESVPYDRLLDRCTPPAVRTAVEEHSRLLALAEEAVRDKDAANRYDLREAAEREDLAAAATAFAAGKTTDPRTAVKALDKRVAEANRRAEVAWTALRAAYVHLRETVNRNRAGWLADLDASAGQAADTVREVLSVVPVALERSREVDNLAALVSAIEGRKVYGTNYGPRQVVIGGNAYPVAAVLDALAASAASRVPVDRADLVEFVAGTSGTTVRAGEDRDEARSLV